MKAAVASRVAALRGPRDADVECRGRDDPGAHFWLAAERQISVVRRLPRPDPIAGCDDSELTRRPFDTIWRVDQEAKPELVRLVDQHKHGKVYQHVTSPDLLSSIQ